jgi:hypothetical protein
MMQAFPLGALNLLVSVASSVAAQHGAENARRVCSELATNDDLWTYIASRLSSTVAVVDERLTGPEREGVTTTDLLRNDPANARATAGRAPLEGEPLNAMAPPQTEAAPSLDVSAVAVTAEPEVARGAISAETIPGRAGARKAKTRRRSKTTGRERNS